MFYLGEGWYKRDCEGDDLNNWKWISKTDCKSKCDSNPQCNFATYGGNYGITGISSDWWAQRCVLRKNYRGNCRPIIGHTNHMMSYFKNSPKPSRENSFLSV